jgi:hypothetical protein
MLFQKSIVFTKIGAKHIKKQIEQNETIIASIIMEIILNGHTRSRSTRRTFTLFRYYNGQYNHILQRTSHEMYRIFIEY